MIRICGLLAALLGCLGRCVAEGSVVDYSQLGNAVQSEATAALRSTWPQMLAVFGVCFGILLLVKLIFHVTKG
jgi:hypothetical protein